MIAAPARASDPPIMFVKILGAAAGGGLPQWNCGCRNCVDARQGLIPAMSQSSVAVSADGNEWLLLNASPDIRDQLRASGLHPPGLRGSPVSAVVLTNGDIDHIAGLLVLRESTPFAIHATPATLAILDQPVFGVLNPDLVRHRPIGLDRPFDPLPGLRVTAFAVPGKVALFLEQGGEVETDLIGEQTIGLRIEGGGRRLFYIPGCARVTPAGWPRTSRITSPLRQSASRPWWGRRRPGSSRGRAWSPGRSRGQARARLPSARARVRRGASRDPRILSVVGGQRPC